VGWPSRTTPDPQARLYGHRRTDLHAKAWQLWNQDEHDSKILGRINILTDLELADRIRVLEGERDALKAAHDRWSSMSYIVLIPDTNTLRNADLPLDQIDWAAIAGALYRVRLVIPMAVLREMDRHKRNNQLKERARAALKELERLLPDHPTAVN
jgi:PIN domain